MYAFVFHIMLTVLDKLKIEFYLQAQSIRGQSYNNL